MYYQCAVPRQSQSSVNERYRPTLRPTLQCIINVQSRVTEKIHKDGRIIRDRIIVYY